MGGGKIPRSQEYPEYTPITLYIGGQNRSFYGYLEQGDQRIQLPNEATDMIFNALENGNRVGIAITERYSVFEPEDFCHYAAILKK